MLALCITPWLTWVTRVKVSVKDVTNGSVRQVDSSRLRKMRYKLYGHISNIENIPKLSQAIVYLGQTSLLFPPSEVPSYMPEPDDIAADDIAADDIAADE